MPESSAGRPGTQSALDTDPARRARYSQGAGIMRIIPDAVARPATVADLRVVLDAARRMGLAVTPRGAGTAMDGSNVGAGVVVDMSRFGHSQPRIDVARRLAVVSPSLTAQALNDASAGHGLRLPVDPSSGAWATVGGMISTNASGPRSMRHGSIRRWVEALVLETADGPLHLQRGVAPDGAHPVVQRWMRDVAPRLDRHVLERYPATTKNSAGYALDAVVQGGDLLDAVIGAEGTLGLITEAELRLVPLPAVHRTIRVALRSRDDIPGAVRILRDGGASAVELLDASFLRVIERAQPDAARLLADGAVAVLLAEFEGEAGAVDADAASAARRLAPVAMSVEVGLTDDASHALWAVRHGASPALARLDDGRVSLQVIEDGCVPLEGLPRYLDLVERACAGAGVDMVMFGHAGDGHVHVNLLPDLHRPDWLGRVRRIYADVNRGLVSMGGTPSGEHGAGRLRAPLMPMLYGDEICSLFERVRDAFDPERRFNPGVITGAADPFASLKVGGDAPALDVASAHWLRELERGAAWGVDRWDPAS